MPKKKITKKKSIITVPTARTTPQSTFKKTNLPKAQKKVKHSPVEYYNCLLTQVQSNWINPATGKRKKITACCSECKMNAPALNQQRNSEIKKLITSYQQVGDSLSKLLKPIQ